jgi:A/G-specific adenine glycosylase
MKVLTASQVKEFQANIRHYYQDNGRNLPWRSTDNPYEILVSEFMLQQTQVQRVVLKYHPFLRRFPTVHSLAVGPLKDVLGLWSGLGYNRRALALIRTANLLTTNFAGLVPKSPEELCSLPGIGRATAGAICAFAHNKPVVFVETNIRRVFIHFFFKKPLSVHDRDVLPLVDQTLDRINPRHWYYALMDFGSMLKGLGTNPNKKSVHYHRQARFEDSDRQVRGLIIRSLLAQGAVRETDLARLIGFDSERTNTIVQQLLSEGFLTRRENKISVA